MTENNVSMLRSLMDASSVNKTELSEELEYGCRATLYSRLEDARSFTLGEVETLSKYMKVSVRDLSEVIYGNEAVYNRLIAKITKQSQR